MFNYIFASNMLSRVELVGTKQNAFNPRGAGVSSRTRGAGGGKFYPPPVISRTNGPIWKIQTPIESSHHELLKTCT